MGNNDGLIIFIKEKQNNKMSLYINDIFLPRHEIKNEKIIMIKKPFLHENNKQHVLPKV